LEEKVRVRTVEIDLKNAQLEDSNQKLIKQSSEIIQINSILDLDNWKLKNRVKEVLEERMHETQMDYVEFSTLYSDDLACLRFLEKMKEQTAFECLKCGNSKYSAGAQKFSRRCTKCGYSESITANTLFHGIKFPITKAFYLTYVSVSEKSHLTLETLSEKLDLRLNTVWAFRQKVYERVATMKERKTHFNSWEEIVLDPEKTKHHSKKLRAVAELHK
jgi:tRNA(Ile2) C34 agmatinyltransferase TiaS